MKGKEHIGKETKETNNFKVYVMEGIADIPPAEIDCFMKIIPQWRSLQAAAFSKEEGRKECVLSFMLLMQALREWGITEPVEFDYLEHGKPILRNHKTLFFNISHCREAVACIVGRSYVGIDIERRGRYKKRFAQEVLNDEEFAQVLAAEDSDLAFTRLWTQKEALLKLIGIGVSTNMKSAITDHPEITLTTYDRSSYVCSIAHLDALEPTL